MKAYKLCGIMENSDEACSNYLPSSLTSEKQTFRLVEGATLGVE